MKKQLPILLLILFIAGCSSNSAHNTTIPNSESTQVYSIADDFSFTPLGNEFKIHSQLVDDYFKQEEYDYSKMNASINAKTELGDNLPIKIQYSWQGYPEASSFKVKVYDKSDNQVVFEEITEQSEINFINYKIGPSANYTCEVIPVLPKIPSFQKPFNFNFSIPNGYLRTITVDGVNNFRDLGDGVHLKQGLIYRSATFENNTSANEDHPLSITELGKKQIAYLGLKSEIDLRKDDEKAIIDKSAIGLNYFKAPMYYGGQNLLTYKNSEYNNPEVVKNIFEFLSNEENYPVDFHCVRGTDRTGCIAYLLKGLLGFSEEELYRDYLFSNFYNIGSPVKLENIYYAVNPNSTAKYVNVIKQTEGDTLKDKIYNYLSSEKVGVQTASLDKIIDLLKA